MEFKQSLEVDIDDTIKTLYEIKEELNKLNPNGLDLRTLSCRALTRCNAIAQAIAKITK